MPAHPRKHRGSVILQELVLEGQLYNYILGELFPGENKAKYLFFEGKSCRRSMGVGRRQGRPSLTFLHPLPDKPGEEFLPLEVAVIDQGSDPKADDPDEKPDDQGSGQRVHFQPPV